MTARQRSDQDAGKVLLGKISGLFGVRGWIKVFSYTAERGNILDYPVWQLKQQGKWVTYRLLNGHPQGKGVVAQLEGVVDRDQAALLIDQEIAIDRQQLPQAAEGEYYWSDLQGLHVVTRDGVELGVVDHLFETGANDVMSVQGERTRLLPFIDSVIGEVDLSNGVIRVDWDPEF